MFGNIGILLNRTSLFYFYQFNFAIDSFIFIVNSLFFILYHFLSFFDTFPTVFAFFFFSSYSVSKYLLRSLLLFFFESWFYYKMSLILVHQFRLLRGFVFVYYSWNLSKFINFIERRPSHSWAQNKWNISAINQDKTRLSM